MGYSDEKIRALCREALADGWTHFKVKVGGAPEDDARRVAPRARGDRPDRTLMIDANQRWDVGRGDRARPRAGAVRPLVDRGADEPGRRARACGDREGGARRIGVATGEHCANRVIFKQLLQAEAIDFCQIDSCRLGGVNENLAVILMAAKFGVPVCPHAGGVGLCEYVQHLSMFDYIAVSGTMDGRVIEFVDHLHEHFVDPVVVRRGRYMRADAAGLQHHDPGGVARSRTATPTARSGWAADTAQCITRRAFLSLDFGGRRRAAGALGPRAPDGDGLPVRSRAALDDAARRRGGARGARRGGRVERLLTVFRETERGVARQSRSGRRRGRRRSRSCLRAPAALPAPARGDRRRVRHHVHAAQPLLGLSPARGAAAAGRGDRDGARAGRAWGTSSSTTRRAASVSRGRAMRAESRRDRQRLRARPDGARAAHGRRRVTRCSRPAAAASSRVGGRARRLAGRPSLAARRAGADRPAVAARRRDGHQRRRASSSSMSEGRGTATSSIRAPAGRRAAC